MVVWWGNGEGVFEILEYFPFTAAFFSGKIF